MAKRVSKREIVHWTYNNRTIDDVSKTPKNSYAFIYKISLENGKYYFGKKYIWKPKYTSGKLKGQSKGEYPWKTYTSSSKEVKELIAKGMKYTKEILMFTYSKAETTYLETKTILCNNALTDPNSLNYWVKATIYSKHLEPNT